MVAPFYGQKLILKRKKCLKRKIDYDIWPKDMVNDMLCTKIDIKKQEKRLNKYLKQLDYDICVMNCYAQKLILKSKWNI